MAAASPHNSSPGNNSSSPGSGSTCTGPQELRVRKKRKTRFVTTGHRQTDSATRAAGGRVVARSRAGPS
eukprot:114993-Lingulodinium_polyedra.AAC.1